jgi:hypothetical protein
MEPVSAERLAIATKFGLSNVPAIAHACRRANVSFAVACALAEKESGGRNVYGHDAGGALSGFPYIVNEGNYQVFYWLVVTKGQTSNGVGPAQITYRGFHVEMLEEKLHPWIPEDNLFFGLRLLRSHRESAGSWQEAGAHYNGGSKPNSTALAYGRDLAAKIEAWKGRLG